MKQILVLQGGGRPGGNTAQLIREFVRGAESAGHSAEVFSLTAHEVKGCLGCNACRYGKPCVQKDVPPAPQTLGRRLSGVRLAAVFLDGLRPDQGGD